VPALGADADTFGELVDRHHVRLTHLAFMLCGDRAQAEDAVAEAYARVWPRFRRGRVTEPLPYLRRAVVNQVNGALRRLVLERREASRCEADARVSVRVEEAVNDRETLRPALLALPAPQRAVVVLRYLEDLSEDETASLLGIQPGTVKSRSARALEQLRRLLGESR
jgi:RNA polymerase sigma-70 factor (sigma-E family)